MPNPITGSPSPPHFLPPPQPTTSETAQPSPKASEAGTPSVYAGAKKKPKWALPPKTAAQETFSLGYEQPTSYYKTFHGYRLDRPFSHLAQYPEVTDKKIHSRIEIENDRYAFVMRPYAALENALFARMKKLKPEGNRQFLKEERNGYIYESKIPEGQQFKQWTRTRIGSTKSELLLDENIEAAKHDNYRFWSMSVSPDDRFISLSFTSGGSEKGTCEIRRLKKDEGDDSAHEAPCIVDEFPIRNRSKPIWTPDSEKLIFSHHDKGAESPHEIRLHTVGEASASDKTIFSKEFAEVGYVSCAESSDKKYIFIDSGDWTSNEIRLLRTANPEGAPELVRARQDNVKYDVDASHGKLWILTNDEHPNFRLAEASVETPSQWTTVIEGKDNCHLRDLAARRDHLLLTVRKDGLDQLVLFSYETGEQRNILDAFKEKSYTASFCGDKISVDFAAKTYRFEFTAQNQPPQTYEFDPLAPHETSLKQIISSSIPDFNPADYTTEHVLAPCRDGKEENAIPIDICFNPNFFKKDGTGKVWISVYGDYGLTKTPVFQEWAIAMMEQGYAIAIIHPRGSGAKGEIGKMAGMGEHRENTFNDVVDGTDYFVKNNYAKLGKIAIYGTSSGGTAVGAALNMAPHYYGAAVTDGPFVNVLETMLNEKLPYTPGEWGMRGNPIKDEAAFLNLFKIDPDKQVRAQDYPPIRVRQGLDDKLVTYWEPLEWLAKIQNLKTNDNPAIIKIDPSGHLAKAGTDDKLKEDAERCAFVLAYMGGLGEEGKGTPCKETSYIPHAPIPATQPHPITSEG